LFVAIEEKRAVWLGVRDLNGGLDPCYLGEQLDPNIVVTHRSAAHISTYSRHARLVLLLGNDDP
jgi:hypothetical protein